MKVRIAYLTAKDKDGRRKMASEASYPDDYAFQAEVEVPDHLEGEAALDFAYTKTQHVDEAWWENSGTTKLVDDQLASTQVGDVFVLGDTAYACDRIGWKKIIPDILTPADIVAAKVLCCDYVTEEEQEFRVSLIRGKVKRFATDKEWGQASDHTKWLVQMANWVSDWNLNLKVPSNMAGLDSREWFRTVIQRRLDEAQQLSSEEEGWESTIKHLEMSLKLLSLSPFRVWSMANAIEDTVREQVSEDLLDMVSGHQVNLTKTAQTIFDLKMAELVAELG